MDRAAATSRGTWIADAHSETLTQLVSGDPMRQFGNCLSYVQSALCAVALTACASGQDSSTSGSPVVEDDPTPAKASAEFRHRPRFSTGGASSTGSTGGSSNTGGSANSGDAGPSTADCGICAKANDCCNALGAGALCTFSATTCSTLSAASQASYANNCKSLLVTVTSAWATVNATPPQACN